MEDMSEEAVALIVLFEEFLRKATLLSGKVEQFPVVERHAEVIGNPCANNPASTSKLSAYGYYDFVLFLHNCQSSFYPYVAWFFLR